MHLSTFIFGLPLLASICSATPHFKRAILDDVMLYAYGTNISGYGLAYGDADGEFGQISKVISVLISFRSRIYHHSPVCKLLVPDSRYQQHWQRCVEWDH
jgi:hypothetical protein